MASFSLRQGGRPIAAPQVIERADGVRRKVAGVKASAKPQELEVFHPVVYTDDSLPAKVDLRPYMTTVENQGAMNSCTANATAGAYEYLVRRLRPDDEAYDVSRLFLYYNARLLDADGEAAAIKDDGATIWNAIESLKADGACSEVTWPYVEDPETVGSCPPEPAYDEGKRFVIQAAEEVKLDVTMFKHALAEGLPIVFACCTYTSFDNHRKKGLVPMPTAQEAARKEHGGHAMLVVGYSDAERLFIVRNSWGSDWGDKGYCYMPYDYVCSEKYNFGENFIIRRLDIPPEFLENAAEDEEPVVENLEGELANMSDEDYSAMLEAMGEYPLELRIAHLLLMAANADGEISEEEAEGIAEYMQHVMDQLGDGSQLSAKGVMRRARKLIRNKRLLDESITLLWEHLSYEMLEVIARDIKDIISADSLSRKETKFIEKLCDKWEIDFPEDEDEEDEETEDAEQP